MNRFESGPSRNLFRLTRLLFRELVRDKIFWTLSMASILLVLASLILNEMVVGIAIKATRDLGLSVLNLFSLFILIFSGISQVSKDLANKSLYFLFSKSVSRPQYLLASVLAITLTIASGILVILTTIFLLSAIQHEMWLAGLLTAGALTLLEMLVLLVLAILFALITSPQLAMFLTLIMYVIGHTMEQAAQIVDKSNNLVLKYIIIAAHALLPNLEFFNKKTEIIYRLPIPGSYFVHAAVYALSYATLIVLLSIWVFKNKEI
ncbi:MAG: hypothetical protein ACM3SY_16360 [Candidatus Omnitrophota bacterium]